MSIEHIITYTLHWRGTIENKQPADVSTF